MNNKIELADGSLYDGTVGVIAQDMLLKTDLATSTALLPIAISNPEKLETISFYYGAYKDVCHGFSHFGHLEQDTATGRISIWLYGSSESYVETKIPTVNKDYLPKE